MGKPSKELIAALLADPAKAECPNCGGVGFYDNRNSPKRGKGPAFKCKSKECDDNGFPYGVFARDLPKEEQAGKSAAPRVVLTWKQLGTAYHECVKLALHEANVAKKAGHTVDVAAMAATLLITREKMQCWPASEAPAEQPPPPPAKPVVVQRDDEEGYAGGDDLPF